MDHGRWGIADLFIKGAEIIAHSGVGRVFFHGPGHMTDCFIEPAGGHINIGQVDVGFEMVRLDGQGLLKMDDGRGPITSRCQGLGQIVVGFIIVPGNGQGVGHEGFRIFPMAGLPP